jgi:mono/diheme cytochrome c family protein
MRWPRCPWGAETRSGRARRAAEAAVASPSPSLGGRLCSSQPYTSLSAGCWSWPCSSGVAIGRRSWRFSCSGTSRRSFAARLAGRGTVWVPETRFASTFAGVGLRVALGRSIESPPATTRRCFRHALPQTDGLPVRRSQWVATQRIRTRGADRRVGLGATAGKGVFLSAGCGSCHTLAAAGTRATVGPNLDMTLKGKTSAFLRTSIVDPNATIAHGYERDVMPTTYQSQLTAPQIADLVSFLLKRQK